MPVTNNKNHRRLIRLKGPLAWCYQQCEALIKQYSLPYFWLGDSPETITPSLYKQILGQEISLLIINAHQQFDANQFAASEGTLRGGGLLILISPTDIDSKDHFYTYIDEQLTHYPFLTIQPNDVIAEILKTTKKASLHLDQQNKAIDAIIKTVTGHRRRPLVLTANRGRGKSAALGFAAKQLIELGINKILVCAPNKSATTTLFKHAGESSQITFIAPDELLAAKPSCDLLMIDEAAALPVPMLEALTQHYSRLVFATTLHGYEGSGRGFALRFQKHLKEIAPQTRFLHLDQPIRWDKGDPLEQFTLEHLCLTECQTSSPTYDVHKNIQFEEVTTQQLLADTALLTEIFSLLVIAHYQTKPSDLARLLNDPQLSIFVLKQSNCILSVALVNHEGELDKQLAEAIYQGKRRLHGHLVPQSLTFHCAHIDAARHKYARIQRIATHPSIQQQGLGQLFIDKITHWATTQHFDHLCASFGATESLLRFWQKSPFETLRIGSSKDKSSGTHSFIVNLPISNQGKQLHDSVIQQFHKQLPVQLTRQLHQLDPELIITLLKELPINDYQHPLIDSYCAGNLPYEFAEFELMALIINSDLCLLAKNQQTLTIQKVLQNKRWSEICQHSKYSGKKQVQQALRNSIQQLLTTTHKIEE